MALSDAELLLMQAPLGTPHSDLTSVTTDPIIPPMRTTEVLSHFHERIYDLSPETHISKLLKVLLGEAGVGGLQKKVTYSHLSQVISSIRYFDLDRFYADVIGVRRLTKERLGFDPYDGVGDTDEWEEMTARDSEYRNRVGAFSRAIIWAGTPSGMVHGAAALLGYDVRVYESWVDLDESETIPDTPDPEQRTYGDVEALGPKYGDLEKFQYGEIETSTPQVARLANSRGEFFVKPLRPITAEERMHLIYTLNRIKPAEALMTIDTTGGILATSVPILRAVADSEYWHIRSKVFVREQDSGIYARSNPFAAVEQPRPLSGYYQGEAWNYNADVTAVSAYSTSPLGTKSETTQGNHLEEYDPVTGEFISRLPSAALASPLEIMQGRLVSDGVISSSPVLSSRSEEGA